jgi:hypothetical protein
MKIYVYIHICCINNWIEIYQKLLSDIKESGLYDKIDKIRCVVLTPSGVPDELFRDKKIELIGVFANQSLFEQATLHPLHDHSLEDDFYVLYLHTKGVRHNNTNPCVNDWVKALSYFNIYQHETCIKGLEENDAVGVNLSDSPCKHYSGNFWWSKSSYLRTLQKCDRSCYNSPEFWVTSHPGKFLNLWTSGVNHYTERCPESLYIL